MAYARDFEFGVHVDHRSPSLRTTNNIVPERGVVTVT